MRATAHNRRWLARLLTLAMLLMATASGASWSCPDGTLCPYGGRMPHAALEAMPSHINAAPAPAHCPLCHPAPAVAPSHNSQTASAGLRCILSRTAHTAASLQTATVVPVSVTALLPQPLFIAPVATVAFAPVTSENASPRDGPYPHNGRAPPACA